MQKRPELEISVVEVTGNIGLMRFNALHPPFDNPAIRRALLPALDQAMFMNAIAGDQSKYWRDQVGYFAPDTPMASSVGMEALAGPRSADRARQLLQEAGYKGERVVPLSPGDYPRIAALSLVAADMLTRCGMNVNVQTIDWDSVIRRRASKAKPEDGDGASSSPRSPVPIWPTRPVSRRCEAMGRPTGSVGRPRRSSRRCGPTGWPQPMRRSARRSRPRSRRRPSDVPFLPLGQFFQPTARSRRLTGGLTGMPLFWNINRS